MTSYSYLVRKRKKIVKGIVSSTPGIDEHLAENILIYAESLLSDDHGFISETTFVAEMAFRFNLTNRNMIALIMDVLKHSRRTQTRALTLHEYCRLMCIFLTDNLDLRIDFVFSVYDFDRDGSLSRNEIYTLLRPSLPTEGEDLDEMLKELVEMVLKTVEHADHQIDLEHYRKLVKKNVLYIQLLGQCLPSDSDIRSFKQKLKTWPPARVKQEFENQQMVNKATGFRNLKQEETFYPIDLEL